MPELTATKPAQPIEGKRVNRIPLSTYRLQLSAELDLEHVQRLLPYLQQLGISDLYLSPLFRSRAESSHGYDVVDHGAIDPDIGDLASFERLAEAARNVGMGILLDVVPNHMGINDPANSWWLDVLENGEGSYFADFFDIEWHPAASACQDKILLPFLGEPFGKVLENGELRVVYAEQRLQLEYGKRRFPLAPPSWVELLDIAAQRAEQSVGDTTGTFADLAELQSIVTQLRNLPAGSRRDAHSMEERYREQGIARQRLHALTTDSPAVSRAFQETMDQINGEVGNARSFDQLERLLEGQWYRLAYWRVAADEINYRRFFDINDLAAIRVENPRVFDAVHRLVARLVGAGWVTGLRIDHPDGLRDPRAYFKRLQQMYRTQQSDGDSAPEIYIVAEKILTGDEPLPSEWAVCGTTGYDLMNAIGRVQLHEAGYSVLRAHYDAAVRFSAKPADIIYESKRTVLFASMASELQMLAADLYRIAQSHRAARDFTRPALQRALREIISCMSVYRTYVRGDSWEVSEADYRTVVTAVRMARRRNPTFPTSVFDFVASVLLLEHPPTLTDEQAAERREFALNLQQVTGPVTAKGVEDTAFYRYYPLASLNEVGGELDAKALGVEDFQRLMRHRMEAWPHSLSATATHDSKRGEDVRARLHVLSEMPAEWNQAFQRWQAMNQRLVRELDGDAVPDVNEACLIYQTLVGTWPHESFAGAQRDEYRGRIVQYIEKALREAKVHTSWMNPADAYEASVRDFIDDLLGDPGRAFVADLTRFVSQIADCGFVNSLAQLVLKMTLPGVPDFYQGTELWDFSLVDPDNRRPVDFEARRQNLQRLLAEADRGAGPLAQQLSEHWPDPDIKLWMTYCGLNLRRELPELFSFGEYIPVMAAGPLADHVISFARRWERNWAITVVPRHFHELTRGRGLAGAGSIPQADWQDTQIVLPEEAPSAWRCAFSAKKIESTSAGSDDVVPVVDLFRVFPVTILVSNP